MNLMQEEYFWSVVVEENSIQAAIWNVKDGAANVVSVSHPAAYQNDETILTATDSSLSFCIQNLPETAMEPSKTVFGVPSSWVTSGQIDRKYLDKIRLICNKLSLTPTGFVVIPEAIAHLQKYLEKTPISSVLIGVYSGSLDISIFRLGNLIGSVNVARSTNIIDDVIEGLVRFGQTEPLPSRFLLYDSKIDDLEEAKQNLIQADWENYENIKFLHTPQVEVLDNESKMAAVSLAGAAEMGQTTAINFKHEEEKPEDIKSSSEVDNIEGMVDPATLGFTTTFDLPMANPTQNAQKNPVKINFNLNRLKHKMREAAKGNFVYIAIVFVFFVLVGSFLVFWFLPKAHLTIIVDSQKINGRQNVKFDINAKTIDYSKLIIPAKLVSTTANAEKTKTTTGTATIGNASKGSVTFYNVGNAMTIPSGTILTASNLNFTLDSDVQIASASGAASAANAKGNITASQVGADSNLAAGTYFSVGNFSSSLIQAKNDSDLSGGSSQEVTAVSKDDINSLTTDLNNQLVTQAKDQLKTNLTKGYLLIDSSVNATPSSKIFDHKINEEASTLKLSMTEKVTGLIVARDDLNNLAKKIFASQIKNGYVLSDSQIDFVFEPKDVNFIINLLPIISRKQITNQVAGKNENDVRLILKNIPGLTDIQIDLKPKIPFLKSLPHVPDNISVSLISN
jgi:hypothetical protein